jgi:hypothetical protein
MKNDSAAAPVETAPEKAPEPAVQLVCTILENGVVIDDCHHAAGKVMSLPEAKAKALADLGKVRIDGA